MKRPGSAFTLLEVLVVLLIVSLMTGVAVINLPSFVLTDEFEQESERLRAIFGMIRDEAVMQSSEYGFRIGVTDAGDAYTYGFYVYDMRQQIWEKLLEPPYRERTVQRDVSLELFVEEGLELTAEDPPGVRILSSGELTPFTLLIEHVNGESRELTTDGYGDVDWITEQL